MVNNNQEIENFVHDINHLASVLKASGNNGPATFFANAAQTLSDLSQEEKWLMSLKDVCQSAPIAQYGDFRASDEKLLYHVIEQGISIRKSLGIHN